MTATITKEDRKQWSIDKKSELKEKLDSVLDKALTDPGKMRELTDHYRVLGTYNYSFNNSCMVYAQGGKLVQSFKKWEELGRMVIKGQHARIYIFVPLLVGDKSKKEKPDGEEKAEEKKKLIFKLAPVFDVTQTEGEPLKYAHDSADTAAVSFDLLAPAVQSLTGLPVKTGPTGEIRGWCSKFEIMVSESSNNADKVRTLVHEAAHALLEHCGRAEKSRESREVEAEAVANLVISYFGMDVSLSEAYLAGYSNGIKSIDKQAILKTTDKLIKAFKPKGNE